MKKMLAALAFASVMTGPSIVAAQTTIGSGGGSEICCWGKPDTQTYGQTFTAPAVDNTLNSFSFWIGGGSALTFKAYVFAWDVANVRASGAALFASASTAAPAGAGTQRVDVATGGVSLLGGGTYVMFLSTSGLPGDDGDDLVWESTGGDGYASGAFVFINNGDDMSAWTSQTWSTNWQGQGSDLRFEANFNTGTVVPEPSTYALMAFGLAGLGFAARRRRVS